MDFRKALVSSLGAPAAKPVVRLTAEDIARANLHQPGTLSRLLKKLERVSHVRNARGSACQRCRSQKKRCDGGGPCSLCAAAGTNCSNCNKDPEGLEISPQDATDFLETLTHPSPEPPLSRTFVPCRSPRPAARDTMCPSMGGMGMLFDLGWRSADIERLFNSCPPKLRSALDRLSCALPHLRKSVQRKPLPALTDDERDMFESKNVCRARLCLERDGSKSFLFNSEAASHYGCQIEYFAALMANGDMPMLTTHYRFLCWNLELLFQMCTNTAGFFDIFSPYTSNRFAPGEEGEKWHVHRWRYNIYADGIQSTGVLITPEEFDRGIAQRADALGVFAECGLSGADLYCVRDLMARESFASLRASQRGRRTLDALADKVAARFGLDSAAGPGGPGQWQPRPSPSQLDSEHTAHHGHVAPSVPLLAPTGAASQALHASSSTMHVRHGPDCDPSRPPCPEWSRVPAPLVLGARPRVPSLKLVEGAEDRSEFWRQEGGAELSTGTNQPWHAESSGQSSHVTNLHGECFGESSTSSSFLAECSGQRSMHTGLQHVSCLDAGGYGAGCHGRRGARGSG